MLGHELLDPLGIEGEIRRSQGLALLDMSTSLASDKQLRNVKGQLCFDKQVALSGYEIHAGITTGPALERPMIRLGRESDGAISPDGQIMGTYVHGLFGSAEACAALLRWAGLAEAKVEDYYAITEVAINRLADAIEHALDMDALYSLIKEK